MGLLSSILRSWRAHFQSQSLSRRRMALVRSMCQQWLIGSLRSYFSTWAVCAQQSSALELQCRQHAEILDQERQRWEAYVAGDAVRRQEELNIRDRLAEQRRQRAHNSIELTVRKWMIGCVQGVLKEVLSLWSKFAA